MGMGYIVFVKGVLFVLFLEVEVEVREVNWMSWICGSALHRRGWWWDA